MSIPKLQLETIKLKDLINAEYNPRKNTKEQQKHLTESLKKFGCVEPIIVNRHPDRYNIIVGGHFRVQELIKQHIEEIECVIVNLNPEEEKELNLRLNANTGDWDYNLLYNNFTYSNLEAIGFDFNKLEAEATKLLNRYNELLKEEETKNNNDNNKQEFTKDNKRNIKEGDIFILRSNKTKDNGDYIEHRLICGDSLNKDNIKILMNNKKASMVFTDPPYNINISNRFTKINIANDNLDKEEFNKFLNNSFKIIKDNIEKEAHIYICCNEKCIVPFKLEANKYFNDNRSSIFYWIKDIPGLGYGYREQYEMILFYTDQETIKFYDKTESNVWEAPKTNSPTFKKQEKDNITNSTTNLHPTIKPTSLIARAIKNSSLNESDIILDIFGGSGSTLIASERMGRTCYMSELDPFYCNVIVDRWEKLTGQEAIKLEEDE